MKKLFILSIIFCAFTMHAHSQNLLKAATSAASGGFDVKSIASNIMSTLTPSLNLTGTQQPGVSSAITNFLSSKAKILPLQKTDPAGYATKQSGLFSSLKSKLGTILLANQMKKFLGLKPKTNDASNVLSNLFY